MWSWWFESRLLAKRHLPEPGLAFSKLEYGASGVGAKETIMYHLSPIDMAIIVGYFVLTLSVGLAMSRRASSSLDQYFLGGRSLPWYLLGIAGMTNWFDLTGTMIITSFLYMLGPRGLFIEFRGGAVLMLAFLLAYTGKWHRRSGCMTGAEWTIYRFG